MGPAAPFLWISIDKTFAIGNLDRVRQAMAESPGAGVQLPLSNGAKYSILGVIFTYISSSTSRTDPPDPLMPT